MQTAKILGWHPVEGENMGNLTEAVMSGKAGSVWGSSGVVEGTDELEKKSMERTDGATWGKTWNGADALDSTGSALLDMFGRAGAMRAASVEDKQELISKAYSEDADAALKLLFYVRDIRAGYGERDTFNVMFRKIAEIDPEAVENNLWAVMEFGRAKDLYSLIGTPAEDAMWRFMKAQFELDFNNMNEGKSISLLAKWIATPDSASKNSKELGELTAKKLGYGFKTMSKYRKKLRAMRQYLDLPEAKMCTGAWESIEYSKVSSKFIFKFRKAIMKHDADRFNAYMESVKNGEAKINTGTLTPCDIFYQMRAACGEDEAPLELMWSNLKDVCDGNAIVMCDTSGSMIGYSGTHSSGARPIDVAVSLAIYFAERNKGDLKDMMINFSDTPIFIKLDGGSLSRNLDIALNAPVNYSSTNLEGAFDLLLSTAIKSGLRPEDMPDAIMVISDMQINCVNGIENASGDQKLTFYESMKLRYENAGYKLPHVIFWNVNAQNPTFHAARSNNGVSMVSGYSPNVFKQVMDNVGKTPMDLLMAILNDPRYEEIKARR